MTKIFNDPAEFAEEQFAGFLNLYADRLRGVHGGAVSHRGSKPTVAVVVGGGSGHYPAFCGLVGPGLASGAVVGNIFTSPSAAQVYSVAKAADNGRGVILTFGNYAGDVMNFSIAAERLRREGIDTRIVLVTDDVASAKDEEQRRGIAGDFVVFKCMGAAAEAGYSLDEVERIGRKANSLTRSFGVAFSGCTMPGATKPLFTVPAGKMGVGLGIHGEPGIKDAPLASAHELASELVDTILKYKPNTNSSRIGVIVNGLGDTKYEELFLLWGEIEPLLVRANLVPVDAEVGELVTSLDMGGCSLTLVWLDEELESMWRADAYTPAYRKQNSIITDLTPVNIGAESITTETPPQPSLAGKELASIVKSGLLAVQKMLHEQEKELGRIDAVAGDGDHGRGMVKGIDAAMKVAEELKECGPGWILRHAGLAWAAQAGGTSGVLWGAGLEAAGNALGDSRDDYESETFVTAVDAFVSAIIDLGRAQLGDKTVVDALVPFQEALKDQISLGKPIRQAWQEAAAIATQAAKATESLMPKKGRARPLGEKSVGNPDPGAVSFGLIAETLGNI